MPVDLMVGDPPELEDKCYHEYVEWMRGSTQHAFDFAKERLGIAAVRMKTYYDRQSGVNVKKGDTVWYFYPPRAQRKLGNGWTGPWTVIDFVSEVCVRIERDGAAQSKVVHVDNVKPYETAEDESDGGSELGIVGQADVDDASSEGGSDNGTPGECDTDSEEAGDEGCALDHSPGAAADGSDEDLMRTKDERKRSSRRRRSTRPRQAPTWMRSYVP